MGCISAYGMSSLHVLEGTMNAERYIKVLEQHMLPSRWHLFQGRPCVFQQDNAKPHTAYITTAWLACSPALSPIENIRCIIKRKIRQRWPQTLSAAGNLYQAIMGANSNTKTPETHTQTTSNCFEKKRRCHTMVNMPPHWSEKPGEIWFRESEEWNMNQLFWSPKKQTTQTCLKQITMPCWKDPLKSLYA